MTAGVYASFTRSSSASFCHLFIQFRNQPTIAQGSTLYIPALCMCVCVCACVHACVRACVRACMRGCVGAWAGRRVGVWVDGWMDGCMYVNCPFKKNHRC